MYRPSTYPVRALTCAFALLIGLLTAIPASAAPDTGTAATPTVRPGTFSGRGFDTCTAPTASQMRAWLASPYRAIGVYVGGKNRACPDQPNLDASWVSTVTAQGWHLMPLYVGLQAPCPASPPTPTTKISKTLKTARAQGRNAADDAIAQMTALGFQRGNTIYLDMENYDRNNARCVSAVKAFTHAWTRRLQANEFRSGIYGSGWSMMYDLVRWVGDGSYTNPDDIWYAEWDGRATTTGSRYVPDGYWTNQQRAHQYRGNVWQSFGGVRLLIDQNQVDAHTTAAPMSIYSGVPHAQLNHRYTRQLATAGGSAPFTWKITSGALPDGLSLPTSGKITGTPTAVGGRTATVRVTDSEGRTATGTVRLTADFADVPPRNEFYSDIMWLARQGVTQGYSSGDFGPTDQVTRRAMAAFLYRYDTDGSPLPECTSKPFKDVDTGATFCPEVTWLKASGITMGYPDGYFHPSRAVSRQAMAAYLYRMVNGSTEPPTCATKTFWDVPKSDQFCPEITWLASTGVTEGYPDPGHSRPGFHPKTPVSRQAMAAFLHRLAATQN